MASKGRPRIYTDEERAERHLMAMQKYITRKLNGEKIRAYGVYTEEEKKERHAAAMKRYQMKRGSKTC